MLPLAVYATMGIFQWAALPPFPNRQHATLTALTAGRLRLAMSQVLIDEVRGVLFRPELQRKFPSMTPVRAAEIIDQILKLAEWFDNVPRRFSLPRHPKDDHILDLAIESKANYLVTWEARLLGLTTEITSEAQLFRQAHRHNSWVDSVRVRDR